MAELRTGERHVLRHEPRGVGGQGVVHPHVEIHALLAVAVVPKFGEATHGASITCCTSRARIMGCPLPRSKATPSPRPTLTLRPPPTSSRPAESQRQVRTAGVVHEAIHGVDVEQVGLNARRSGVEDVGVKQPRHPFTPAGTCQLCRSALDSRVSVPSAATPFTHITYWAKLASSYRPGRQVGSCSVQGSDDAGNVASKWSFWAATSRVTVT